MTGTASILKRGRRSTRKEPWYRWFGREPPVNSTVAEFRGNIVGGCEWTLAVPLAPSVAMKRATATLLSVLHSVIRFLAQSVSEL